MEEKKKHKVMIGIEVILLGMIIAIVGTNAASSNPPSNGVSYSKNSQTTVEGALNDLYNKANYGNASAGQILKDKTALVGGKKVTGSMPNNVSGTASAVVTYENSLYYRMPAGYYGGLGWGSEISATYTDVANAIGLTAGKLLKGESVLGITGTGETSCPSCPECKECPTPESQGYWKVYKFDKDATYTRTSTGTNTTLSYGDYKRLCADNKGCTYRFTIPLDSGITVKKIHSCTANLSTKNDGPINSDYFIPLRRGQARTTQNGFRISRGYASGTTTGQYWYMHSLQASQVWGDVEHYTVTSSADKWVSQWDSWSDSGMRMWPYQSTTNGFSTSCGVEGSDFVMSVYISDNGISTYDSQFMLSGSIVYQ